MKYKILYIRKVLSRTKPFSSTAKDNQSIHIRRNGRNRSKGMIYFTIRAPGLTEFQETVPNEGHMFQLMYSFLLWVLL